MAKKIKAGTNTISFRILIECSLLVTTILVDFILLGQAWATDKYVSSGVKCHYSDAPINQKCDSFVSSGITSGNDSTGDGSFATPWKTVQKCYDFFTNANGAGADNRCIVRGGAYDSVNGFHTSSNMQIPSGTSWAHPFTTVAYSAGVASGGNCTPATMPKPGDVYGQSTCETVTFYRSMACELASNCTYTVRQMQNTDPGCTDSANAAAECVGVPTLRDCQDLYGTSGGYPGFGGYPAGCWTGTGVGSGTFNIGWWLIHDRTGQLSSSAIIDGAGVNTSSIFTRFVIFDGINFDGRGVVLNIFTNTWMENVHYHPVIKNIKFLNSVWTNCAGSCIAEPGIDNQSQYEDGQLQDTDMYFTNAMCSYAGVPFSTYQIGGVPGRETEYAKFLHCQYRHMGGLHLQWFEGHHAAGQGIATDLQNNTIDRAYVHDNIIGAQLGGNGTMDLSNSLIINNAAVGIQGGGSIGGQAITIRNNTIVAGAKAFPPYSVSNGGTCIQIRKDNNPGTIITNNICSNFQVGVDNYQCGILPDNTCAYTTATQAKNNLIINVSPGNELRNSGNPVVNMTTSGNILNQDPLFQNPSTLQYRVNAGSPAIDAGINNGITIDYASAPRPVGCCIDIGYAEFGTNLGPQAPNTIITSSTTDGSTPLTDPTTATTAQFDFSGSGGTDGTTPDSAYAFSCQIDGGSFSSCKTPKSYSSLTLIQHMFCVKATGNQSGLTDGSPDCFTWTVQANVPPDTSISSGPSSPTTNQTATFSFSASGCTGTCTFTCSLDSASYQSCSSGISYSNLSNSCNQDAVTCNHTFSVRATDGGTGLTDPSPATFNWVVRQQGTGSFDVNTCVQIIASALNVINSWPNGNFVEQHLNGQIEKITATNSATNVGGFTGLQIAVQTGTPTSSGWHSANPANITSVSCPSGSAPDTSITSNPAVSTTATSATFQFTSSGGQSPVLFECNVDSAGYSACTSPTTYSGLSVAAHNFKVRAVGADLLTDASPASFDWTITAATTVFTQTAGQFYGLRNGPNGTQRTVPSANAAINTNVRVIIGGKLTVALQIDATVGNPDAQGFLLYYSKNGGSYAAVPDSFGSDHIRFFGITDTSTDIRPDGTAVPACLTGSAINVGGAVSRRAASILSLDLPQDGCATLQWIVEFQSTAVAGDTYDFRLYTQGGSAIDSYTVTPRATVQVAQGVSP